MGTDFGITSPLGTVCPAANQTSFSYHASFMIQPGSHVRMSACDVCERGNETQAERHTVDCQSDYEAAQNEKFPHEQ